MRAGAEAFESELGPWSCLGDKALRKEVRYGLVPSRACSPSCHVVQELGAHLFRDSGQQPACTRSGLLNSMFRGGM